MLKPKLQKEYINNGEYIQVCMPIDTEKLIPVDDSVRLLNWILEELDYRKLYQLYSSEGRNPVVSPKTLFKILVYAYSQGIYSSRAIEKACKMNLAFIYLLDGQKAPDHNTISRFRKERLTSCIEDLFTQLVQILSSCGEIEFKNLFVDGTKIEANANKYTFVWRKASEKNEAKLQTKAREFLSSLFGFEESLPEHIDSSFINKILSECKDEAQKQNIEFVHGKGKRKEQLQRDIETLEEYSLRQSKYEYNNTMFNGRNSFSKTDTDATFMHLKEDHMRNSQLKPAYNIQAAVESEYIVGIDVSSRRSDMNTLIPLLSKLENNYGRKFENLIADAGYESEENYNYLSEKQITPYIKPSNYKYSKTKKFQKAMEFRLSMKYDSKKDEYTCKNNKKLTFSSTKTRTSASGYKGTSKVYTCESCEGCPYLGKCYKGIYSKTIQVAEKFDRYRKESLTNIKSEEGIKLRINRSIQAEGVFGITKQDMSFTRFLTRGAENVRTEYYLLALGFDINKLHNRIRHDRIGKPLFSIKEAA